MRSKVVGVTVGTPLSMKRVSERIKKDVPTIVDEVYGDKVFTKDDFASDEEVREMLDEIFCT